MYVLLLVMSPFVFVPNHYTMTTFDTKDACQQALIIAKKQWSTIDDKSKCIDLEKDEEIRQKTDELRKLKGE